MNTNGLKSFSLSELAEFDDGRIAEALNQALRRVAIDLDDRPGDDRPRKVLLEIACAPTCDEKGICDSVKMQIQIKDTLPTRKSKVYDLGLRKGGLMVFQPMATDNHRQSTIPMEGDE